LFVPRVRQAAVGTVVAGSPTAGGSPVEAGLEGHTEAGLEGRIAAGPERRIEAGPERRIEAGPEGRIAAGLEHTEAGLEQRTEAGPEEHTGHLRIAGRELAARQEQVVRPPRCCDACCTDNRRSMRNTRYRR